MVVDMYIYVYIYRFIVIAENSPDHSHPDARIHVVGGRMTVTESYGCESATAARFWPIFARIRCKLWAEREVTVIGPLIERCETS